MVTGAGTGIGRAAVKALFGAGYRVVLAGRREQPLEQVIQELVPGGGSAAQALAVRCDVGDPAAVQQLFERTQRAFGRLDVLFNNAGTAAPAVALEDLTYAQWAEVVQVNLTGTFLCTQAAFRMMKHQDPRGGRIINNGSLSAYVPRPRSAPYAATKHAITGLTRATALDGREHDIACGQIDIGNAATAMTAAMEHGLLQADGQVRAEPRIDVDHVGQAVLQMANLPLQTNILFMTIMATKMPYVGRG
jgi:NAD(P)-dependent dehydrogenase (short-subunit alcohol dehydrogenase family)